MGILDGLKRNFQEHFEKKKQEKEMFDRLKLQAEMEKKILFEEQFKKNALEVAKSQAYREAAEKSGLKKLQATNRARRLNSSEPTPTAFAKLKAFTEKNRLRTAENLKRTAEMREVARIEREKAFKNRKSGLNTPRKKFI